MQTNNILILVDNGFASKKEVAIKNTKLMTKNQKHFTSSQLLKFNGVQIKFDLEEIV